MASIKSKNTLLEKGVFRALRKNGIYFQKHYKKALGTPDLAVPSKKIAVFIDGDFWHGYRYTQWKPRLKNKFWTGKIERNMSRDKKYRDSLKRQGWKVLRVWEHEIKKYPRKTIGRVVKILQQYAN